jgi:hypothetical protein
MIVPTKMKERIDSAEDLKILRFTQDFLEDSMIHSRFNEDLKISKIYELQFFPRF